MIATAIDAAPTATMTARGEQSRTRKRIGLPPFFLFSRVSTGVLGSELPKFMPLRSYGEVGGGSTKAGWSAWVQDVKVCGAKPVRALAGVFVIGRGNFES